MLIMHEFGSAEEQAAALADAVLDVLRQALAARGADGRATLAVSGGKSPKLFLETLARREFEWSRVDLTLVDDRWVDEKDEASNLRLLREGLQAHPARAARLIPLVDVSREPQQVVEALNHAELPALPDVAVLGMGEDGHTASLFADAPEWPEAITTQSRFVAMTPQHADYRRISWSLAALKRVPKLFLQIGGAAKLNVLRDATRARAENAISYLACDEGVVLDAYWFA